MGRVYRRVCLLRHEGRTSEAKIAEDTEFAAAEARWRKDAGPEVGDRLAAMKMQEEERVLQAALLAEVLAPMLASRLGACGPRPAAPAPAPSRPLPQRRPGGDIADFIDEMLAQPKAGER